MTDRSVVAVSTLLDQRGITSFHVRLIFWSALIALFDGYDIAAISLAAPHLVREWHVDRAALGPVLSASLVGILFGSMLFGWIGDRFGRKASAVPGNRAGRYRRMLAWESKRQSYDFAHGEISSADDPHTAFG